MYESTERERRRERILFNPASNLFSSSLLQKERKRASNARNSRRNALAYTWTCCRDWKASRSLFNDDYVIGRSRKVNSGRLIATNLTNVDNCTTDSSIVVTRRDYESVANRLLQTLRASFDNPLPSRSIQLVVGRWICVVKLITQIFHRGSFDLLEVGRDFSLWIWREEGRGRDEVLKLFSGLPVAKSETEIEERRAVKSFEEIFLMNEESDRN